MFCRDLKQYKQMTYINTKVGYTHTHTKIEGETLEKKF